MDAQNTHLRDSLFITSGHLNTVTGLLLTHVQLRVEYKDCSKNLCGYADTQDFLTLKPKTCISHIYKDFKLDTVNGLTFNLFNGSLGI